jgi:DNA-binding response OmpR family regulator
MSTAPLFRSALLVEDELRLSEALVVALEQMDIPVHLARTLGEARQLLDTGDYDFILLDRMLTDGDGAEFCAELREAGNESTILMLTARAETADRVEGLESGADDYLTKPFSWDELKARLRALSRRAGRGRPRETAPEDRELWQTDGERLRVRGPKDWVTLTPLEYKLACKLIRAGGSILTRDELLKDVWGFTFIPKTRTVDHFMGRLRKHFEFDPERPRHFLTVRGAGYRFRR